MIKVIKDRRGRKYELHNAALIERPALGGKSAHYIVLRTDLLHTLKTTGNTVITRHKNGTTTFVFCIYKNGRVRIGCRLFYAKDGRKLIRWANT